MAGMLPEDYVAYHLVHPRAKVIGESVNAAQN